MHNTAVHKYSFGVMAVPAGGGGDRKTRSPCSKFRAVDVPAEIAIYEESFPIA